MASGKAFVVRMLLPALCFARVATSSAVDTNVEVQVRLLQQQNEVLQSQLREQKELIESLRNDVANIRKDQQRDAEISNDKSAVAEPEMPSRSRGLDFGKVHLSGEGGAGFF